MKRPSNGRTRVFVGLVIAVLGLTCSDVDHFHDVGGTVADGETGEPMESVTVFVADFYATWRDSFTITDSDGRYLVPNDGPEPRPQQYLEFWKQGYNNKRTSMARAKAKSATYFELNIVLSKLDTTSSE